MASEMSQRKRNSTAAKAAVQVFCRIRPTNSKELTSGAYTCVQCTDANIEVNTEEGQNKFSFDKIFNMNSTQSQVFQEIAGALITDVLSGYNATILAYGQSGTGKTHTMEGDIKSEEKKGIIPRAVDALFDGVTAADENMEFTFKVSYIEVYQEKIRDLLDVNHNKVDLTIREDKDPIKGIYIAGVTEEVFDTPEEALKFLSTGATNRAVAATGLNLGSSRSHSVFTITVLQKDVVTSATKSGKLVLVDLAGSENVRKTKASGQQLEEAKLINKSLSALGGVINALTDEKQSHIPYRDSKLTRILQDSLGGNSKTALIIAVSPSSYNSSETVSTLHFGARAKRIKNEVVINQTHSVEELLKRAEKATNAQTARATWLTTQLKAAQAKLAAQSRPPAGKAAVTTVQESEEALTQRLDLEGRVVVDKAQLEQITAELDEERQESSQKSAELTQMDILLKDKDRLLADAKRCMEALQERSEAELREKIEHLRHTMEEEAGKARFQAMELEVSLNTLQTENAQLKAEIAEMSGDPQTDKRHSTDARRAQQKEGESTPAKLFSAMEERMWQIEELQKKMQLRDARISQLEESSHSQAERHVAELKNLREQIQVLQLEKKALSSAAAHDGMVRKSLRGGGGVKRPLSLGACSSTARPSNTNQDNNPIVRGAADLQRNTSSQTVLVVTAEAVPVDFGEDESPAVTTTDASSQDSEACSNSDCSASLSSADGGRSSRKLKRNMELAEIELQGQPLPKQQRLSLQQRERNSIMSKASAGKEISVRQTRTRKAVLSQPQQHTTRPKRRVASKVVSYADSDSSASLSNSSSGDSEGDDSDSDSTTQSEGGGHQHSSSSRKAAVVRARKLSSERVKRAPNSSGGKVYWTDEMDARLTEGVAKHKAQGWTKVAEFMGDGLTADQCMTRWNIYLEPLQRGLKSGNWQPEEEERLLELMPQHVIPSHWSTRLKVMTQEYTDWKAIGEKLGRVPNDCSSKYKLIQNRKLKKGNFTAEEDALIRQRVEEWGEKGKGLWAAVEKEMGRSSGNIKSRWNLTLSKRK